MNTVFDRCGGFDGIRRVVADFYSLVLASPALARYFDGVDLETLRDHQTKFVAWVMEGPVHFSDEELRRAHAHLGITQEEFLETVGHMRQSLETHGVAPPDVDHVIRAMLRREPLIVSDPEGAVSSGT